MTDRTKEAFADEVRIGLEVHCQLTALKTKLFCSCSSDYREKEPNSVVCPVCFGLPGALPVLNARAVELAAMIGLALNCRVAPRMTFHRKNYFYPDLPKNFQISQYDKAGGVPIAAGGTMALEQKEIRIRRIQLEEDPGKLTYEGSIDKASYSLVDYNRAGIALVEIVTEPDFKSAKEAKVFLEKLRMMIESLGVSNGELEGAMRCDANISIAGGHRVEVKNISSFKEVEKALNYEILRQRTFSGTEDEAKSETRHWDERRSITIALRMKEEEQDYRYFPEPDLPPVAISERKVAEIRRAMPEVPETRAARLVESYGIPMRTAKEMAQDSAMSRYFEEVAKVYGKPSEIANWVMGELRSSTNQIEPHRFADLLKLMDAGRITGVQARRVLKAMISTGRSANEIVGEEKINAVKDAGVLRTAVEEVIAEKEEAARQASNDPKVFNYLIGQVLKREPQGEPKLVAKLLAQALKK